ncbi:MAG: Spy/CpxP family protein refolding chaperone [Burkholderiales bacterium]|nr:Spy/CpxP family protein refolding chaperone [Burkholderiales bacterium]
MKRINFRKALGAVTLIGGTMMAASAMADQPQGAYGHGMMGGYGPGYGQGQGYNMGPGMMGGYGQGYGRNQGYGQNQGYGMGPGMMGDYGPQANVNLSPEQRGKIAKIQEHARRKQWELMGKMQDEQAHMNEQYYSDDRDDDAVSKSYRRMSELRHQMFDLSLSTQKQTDAVLTKEQHGKSWRNGYGMWGK